MVIKQLQVKNFRLLKDFTMKMENELSLVIGKNNVGKTSLLVILDKFLNQGDRKGFQYNDFNLDFRCQLKDLIEKEVVEETKYKETGIQLRLLIEYDDHDDLEYISPILMDLDADNNYLGLGFDYILTYDMYVNLKIDYQKFIEYEKRKEDESHKKGGKYIAKNLDDFLDLKQENYFVTIRKSILIDKTNGNFKEEQYINLKDATDFRLSNVINFQYNSSLKNGLA